MVRLFVVTFEKLEYRKALLTISISCILVSIKVIELLLKNIGLYESLFKVKFVIRQPAKFKEEL